LNENIVNPIAKFYIEGIADEPESIVGVIELFGEDGVRAVIKFTDTTMPLSMAVLFVKCSKDMEESFEFGIQSVIDKKGAKVDGDITIEDFLDE